MRSRASPRLVLIAAFGVVWAVALAFVIATGSGADLRRARETERPARPQTVAAVPAPRAVDEPDAYRPLPRPRPTVVETEAGVPGALQDDEQAAAADGEGRGDPAPSDEEIRAELGQLKDYYASLPEQLSPNAESGRYELTAGQLDGLSGWQSSVASVYFDYGGPLACGGRLRRDQFGVANKNLPCGTLVTFRYGGKALRVPVIDRGPYIKGREWDLTGATAIALGFPGLGPVEWTLG